MKCSTGSVLVSLILTAAALPSFAQQSPMSQQSPTAQHQSSAAPSAAPSSTPAEAPATSAASSATPATAPSTTTPAPAGADKTGPSADLIKRAKNAGLHPEQHHGQTMYCWEDASLGSRFTTKKCTDESGLYEILLLREQEKQEMRQLKSGTRTG